MPKTIITDIPSMGFTKLGPGGRTGPPKMEPILPVGAGDTSIALIAKLKIFSIVIMEVQFEI